MRSDGMTRAAGTEADSKLAGRVGDAITAAGGRASEHRPLLPGWSMRQADHQCKADDRRFVRLVL